MAVITILQFFLMTWGFGSILQFLVRESDNFFERHSIRIGVGLGFTVVISIVLNLIYIPLDWRILIILSLIAPIVSFLREGPAVQRVRLTKANMAFAVVIILFGFNLYMYATGAFVYPYLENEDPVSHGFGVKWLSEEKSIRGQEELSRISYIDPYPPGYDILMALLYQTSKDMFFTLKFFNALIISLGIILFYFAVKRFTGDYMVALFGAIILTLIPSYLSHFIWAHSLIMTLLFPLIYCLSMVDEEKRWWIVAALLYASLWFIQPSKPIKITILIGLFLLVKMIDERRIKKEIWYAGIGGAALSLLWWGSNIGKMISDIFTVREQKGQLIGDGSGGLVSFIKNTFPPDLGTATRVYSFDDFFYVKMHNMINNPVGVGVVLYLMLFAAFLFMVWNLWKGKDRNMISRALVYLSAIPLLLLSVRYLSLLGSPVLTTLYLDLAAMVMISLALVVAVFTRQRKERPPAWLAIAMLWLTVSFLGINSMTFNLPVGLFGFRFWMVFAVPFSIVVGYFLSSVWSFRSRYGIVFLILPIILIGGVFTSGMQKYSVNTAIWPHAGAFTPYFQTDEIVTYNWLRTLPHNTWVYDITGDAQLVSVRDKYMCSWCDYSEYIRDNLFELSAQEIHSILKGEGYQYLIFGANINIRMKHVIDLTDERDEVMDLFNDIANSGLFIPVHQGNAAVIFRIS